MPDFLIIVLGTLLASPVFAVMLAVAHAIDKRKEP